MFRWPHTLSIPNPLTVGFSLRRATAYLYLFVAVAALFALSGRFDPDYDAYRLRFELAVHFAEVTRDPLFALLAETFGERMTYEQFRYLFIALFAFLLFKVTARVSNISLHVRGFVIFLTPFILMKLHVQIREGMALLLWMYAVTDERGIHRSIRTWRFWVLFIVSCALHLSVAAWWATTAVLAIPKNPRSALQIGLIAAAFFMAGAALIHADSLEWVLEDTFLLPYMTANDLGYMLERPSAKAGYWGLFVAIPAFSALLLWKGAASLRPSDWTPSVFGVLGTYALVAFFSAVLVGMIFGSPTENNFILSGRMGETMMMFLTMHLGMTRPLSAWSWVVLAFAMGHSVMQLIAHA